MATDITESQELKGTEINKYDFKTKTTAVFKARKGIDEEIVRQISQIKEEPDWMLEFRLEALRIFNSKPMPEWGGDIELDFQDIYYYLKPTTEQGRVGTMCLKRSRTRLRNWGFPKPNVSTLPA